MENGKELLFKTFNLETTYRTPWVPFVGCHGGDLVGVKADEYLKSSEFIEKGVSKAIELYRPDGIPVIFDLQVEAEILGCNLAWSTENPPSVTSHPLAEGKLIEDLPLLDDNSGRIPIIKNALHKLKNNFPEVAFYGLITGPFTLSLHLMGTDIFLKMYESPEKVYEVIEFSKNIAVKMAEFYIDNGCDVIAIVDPMTSQIDTASFGNFVKDPITEIFDVIRARKAFSSFFVCGNAQHNIEIMCDCNPDNISIDENIPLDYVKEIALKNNVSFGGNLKLTSVLLLGDENQNKMHAVETLDLGGPKGFILSPGCDLPMSTPKENLIAISNIVFDEYEREVARNLELQKGVTGLLDIKAHLKKGKVVIDIITLDSASCPPCQYMVEAVRTAVNEFDEEIYFEEHKIKNPTGIQMMETLGVKKLPTICINGNPIFVSTIPSRTDLVKSIKKYLNE